ncbi:MAG: hypothetical protein AABY18_01105 [Candidatus Thermoplasmatota archaeon]
MEGKLSASRVSDSLYGDEGAETRAWAKDHIERNRGRHVATTRRVH